MGIVRSWKYEITKTELTEALKTDAIYFKQYEIICVLPESVD